MSVTTPMAGIRAQSNEYEEAMRRLREHITKAEDGTFRIDIDDGAKLGINPVVFADLKSSLDRTNQLIRLGEIKADAIPF